MTDAKFIIRKGGAFYRPNCHGYTTSGIQAGRYTESDAKSFSHPNGPDGPRDGMDYFHEDDLKCEDWNAYRALLTQLVASQAQVAAAYEALEIASRRLLWCAGIIPNDKARDKVGDFALETQEVLRALTTHPRRTCNAEMVS